MPREHARVKLTIWDDDDFRDLSPAAQHLYLVLMIHPKLDYCGVTDWRPARLAQFAGGWTAEAVEIAAQELSEALYIIIDTDSEEVLLRSFVRNDELLESPNMAVAVRKAHTAIASGALRGIVVHELRRLRDDKPELKGWDKLADTIKKPSLDPSDYPSFTPSRKGSGNPSASHDGNGSDSPSVTPSPTTAPSSKLPTTSPGSKKTEDQDLGVKRPETLQRRRATEPTCTRHPNGDTGENCISCRAVNQWKEREGNRAAEAAERAEQEARRNCTICDGTGMVVTDDDKRLPTGKPCTDHRRVS